MSTTPTARTPLPKVVAVNVRAALERVAAEHQQEHGVRLSDTEIREALNLTRDKFTRRKNGHIDWTLADLDAIEVAFGIPAESLIGRTR